MKQELEKYLLQATTQISNPEEARLAKLELEDHIMTKIEIMCLGGVSEETAFQKAINEMGSPETLAAGFGFVHNRKYPIRCHILYYASAHTGLFNPEYACKQLAQELAEKLDCPCHNCLDQPKFYALDILIIVGLNNHRSTSIHLHEFIKKLTTKNARQIIFITLPLKSATSLQILVLKGINTQTINTSMSNDSMSIGSISQTLLIKQVQRQEIECIGEIFCLRHFYMPGFVFASERERTLNSLKRILRNYT